ncbi:hypothetical protein C8R46DRAFT_1065049, partial [Mycena filopes]
MGQLSPLDIEELLERCIQYLHDSRRDLAACALVSRSWVYPAQSHLFRAPDVLHRLSEPWRNASAWEHFIQTLSRSTHLIPHIRHLDLVGLTTLARFWDIQTIQFTHLQSVSVRYPGVLSLESIPPLQQLLSLPALRRLTLGCYVGAWGPFFQLWDRCSPSLREIQFLCQSPAGPPQNLPPPPFRRERITLTALHMNSSKTLDYDLMRTLSLFDLSQLRLLYVGWTTEIPWPNFGPVVRHIEALSIFVSTRTASIDLASFPDLSCLRISLPLWIQQSGMVQMAIQILSGIGPASVIRRIIIEADVMTLDGHVCTQLDAVLSSLPMLHRPRVEFELSAHDFEGVWPFFVRMRAHGL